MAVDDQPSLMSQLQVLSRLSMQQKLGLTVAVAAIIAIIVGAWLWETTPDYRVLYTNLSDKDGGAIIASLQQMNVPYKFAEGGGALLVPADKVHETRLKLATQGLPKGSLVGFELLDNEKFGTSQFQEQVNYQRALEGELARTIQSLSPVQSARVHLAIPKPSVFVRDREKPSASVLLNLYPGKALDPSQVTAIAHLVSSSVPELSVKNVTIVDQNGNLLSQPVDELLASGMNPGQLKYLQDTEKSYIKRIEDILTPVVGANNVRAQVTADLDFSQVENTSETYKPNQPPNAATVRSQQVSETSSTSEQKASGVPGSLSNQPPAPVSAPVAAPPNANATATASTKPSSTSGNTANMQKDMTTNYEVDKTIQHVKNQVGGIRRLSVAVVVNYEKVLDPNKKTVSYKPLPANEIKQITDLVKDTMGFDATRGDTLNVVNTAFTSPEVETIPPLPWYKQPDVISLATLIGKNLLIAGVVLYLILGVIRPALRNIKLDAAAMIEAQAAAAAEQQHHAPVGTQYNEEAAEAAKNLARQNPQLVANVIKSWVSGNE